MLIAKAHLMFIEHQKGNMEIDTISVLDLCVKYNFMMITDNPNVSYTRRWDLCKNMLNMQIAI